MGEINLEEDYINFEKTVLRASSLNFTNKDFTPLLYNIYHKKSKKDIERTLNAADENSLFERDNFKNCIIHFVAEFGNIKSFELIFNKLSDAFIDDQNEIGETPLILAAKSGNKDIVQFLIDKGADINKKNIYGLSPISIAAINGQTEIVELLFKKSLEQNKEKKVSEPSINNLNRAPRNNLNDKKIEPVKPSNLSFTNKSPRRINRREDEKTPITKEQTIINYIDIMDEFGLTSLENAIINGHLETVKKLIELGAKINEKDLYYAISNDQVNIAEYLHSIKNFEHSQEIENYAKTAIENNKINILKFLVEKNYSNPNKRDLNGKTLLDYSIENKKEEMVEFLNNKTDIKFKKNKITKVNIIHNTTEKGNQNILKILTINSDKKKYIKNFFKGKDDDGNIPLYYAIKNEDVEMAKYTIEEMYNRNLINEKNFENIVNFLYCTEKKQLRDKLFNNLTEEIVNKIKEVKMGIEIEKFYEEGLMDEKEYSALKYDFTNNKSNAKEKIKLIKKRRNKVIKAKEKLIKIKLSIDNNLSKENKNKIKEIEEKLEKYKVDIRDKLEISEDSSEISESDISERSSVIQEVEEQIPKSKSQTIINENQKKPMITKPEVSRPKTPDNTKKNKKVIKIVHEPLKQKNPRPPQQQNNSLKSPRFNNSDKKLNDLKSINKDLDEIIKEVKKEQGFEIQ